MERFDPATSFGAEVAAEYDNAPRGDEGPAVEFLSALAAGRPALEFAIGTGRIGVPLAESGVEVEGIELSPDMVERLREKASIPVHVGDMTTVATGREYGVVYLVFNTIFNLLTADDQIRCFENAARHLTEDGVFVIEAAIPRAWVDERKPNYVEAEHVGFDRVTFDVARYDPVTQLLEENHVRLTPQGIRFQPIVCRLVTPGELDLMARLAGLRLVDRFGGWHGEPFTGTSLAHVSVYGRA
ncbi:class I SAM-dependent DNA methyltransferase [Tenggerimyces flavus]|uniref:Class I SAM-dependent DNA methyltransferase n=1 Tax=Tenggerimyces flavus TaxID=1708749 RepID=A0ABV7YMV1_9ACTN|nr:class I SAM-dependent methyltransferase [Tenggerimyces flavus]MBM7786284.1 SAM-dependent methyltransferase [Tenggerimyces flavus]